MYHLESFVRARRSSTAQAAALNSGRSAARGSRLEIETVAVHLCALEPVLHDAWARAFADCPSVQSHHANIFERHASALVSPANSFGYMDGGLDLKISEELGWHVERRVRAEVHANFHGELPVGEAVIVETGDARFPYLISAPTMRVPMDVSTTVNAHLAFRAVLRAVEVHNRSERPAIASIACPGLGTGEGRMPPRRCAAQMRYAYEVVARGASDMKGGLAAAVRNHMALLE